MIFRLSLFCCCLGHNTWEKKVSSGLKSISVRGEAIALLLISEEKRRVCSGFCKGSVGCGGEKGSGPLLTMVQSTEPTLTIMQEIR